MLSFDSSRSVMYNRDWLFQLPFLILTSLAAGLLGATFNLLRRGLWRVRASRTKPALRLLEVGACFIPPLTYNRTHSDPTFWVAQAAHMHDLPRLDCRGCDVTVARQCVLSLTLCGLHLEVQGNPTKPEASITKKGPRHLTRNWSRILAGVIRFLKCIEHTVRYQSLVLMCS